MFDDDCQPAKSKELFTPINLENLSIDEIKNYIDELKSEIIRCDNDIENKKKHMDIASSIFK